MWIAKHTYNFQTSQPLTQEQIDYLNDCLLNLPSNDKKYFMDIPEFTTEIAESAVAISFET